MVDVKCPKCGKNFIPAPFHVYRITKKNGYIFYCSWTCYLHRNDKKKKGYHYKHVEQLTPEGKLVQTIIGTAEAAALIDGTQGGISKACKTGKIYKGFLWRYKE